MRRVRYNIEALIDLLFREGELMDFLNGLASFELLQSVDPRFERIFVNPLTAPKVAVQLAASALRDWPVFGAFLDRVAGNGNAPQYPGIRDRIFRLVRERTDIEPAEVMSAVELKEEELHRIHGQLERISGTKVFAWNTVSRGIMGGFLIRFQGRMIDFTVRGALQKAKTSMLSSSN